MDLTLTKRGDYVVRAAIALALAWDGNGAYRKIREVAEQMRLPPSYTPQLLGILAGAGIAEAKAGRGGGYRLTRHPMDVSVLEVVEAAEGPLASRRCAIRGGACRWDDVCALHATVVESVQAVRSTLGRTSLASLAAGHRGEGSSNGPAGGHPTLP
jgi:Rrf2 family protein